MKRLVRSRRDRIIAGVCGGFAEYFQVDPVLVRVVWIFFTLFGGSGILAYILAVIIVPEEGTVPLSRFEETPLKKPSPSTWGIILVVVGLILLLQHGPMVRMVWHSFWGSGINLLFSLLIIAVGGYLIYTRREDIAAFIDRRTALPLHLSQQDKMLYGVCGGIAESLQMDATIIRFLWLFGTFMSYGLGLILYIVLAAVLPKTEYTEDNL
jgi:phage shock protein C